MKTTASEYHLEVVFDKKRAYINLERIDNHDMALHSNIHLSLSRNKESVNTNAGGSALLNMTTTDDLVDEAHCSIRMPNDFDELVAALRSPTSTPPPEELVEVKEKNGKNVMDEENTEEVTATTISAENKQDSDMNSNGNSSIDAQVQIDKPANKIPAIRWTSDIVSKFVLEEFSRAEAFVQRLCENQINEKYIPAISYESLRDAVSSSSEEDKLRLLYAIDSLDNLIRK